MVNLSLQTNITLKELYALLLQLPAKEKLEIAKSLRAEGTAERWRILSNALPDVPEIIMDEIAAEVNAVRALRSDNLITKLTK